jgi:CHRD domain
VKKLVAALAVVLVASLGVTALALGAARGETYNLSTKLDPMLDHAKGAPNAKGSFTATLNGKALTWKLSFSGLTGAAAAAHIHKGKAAVSGPVLIPLCGPCKNGQHGKIMLSGAAAAALEHSGATYVNVHTAKNPNGEIRGQLKSVES